MAADLAEQLKRTGVDQNLISMTLTHFHRNPAHFLSSPVHLPAFSSSVHRARGALSCRYGATKWPPPPSYGTCSGLRRVLRRRSTPRYAHPFSPLAAVRNWPLNRNFLYLCICIRIWSNYKFIYVLLCLLNSFFSFTKVIGCTCVHPCPSLGQPLSLPIPIRNLVRFLNYFCIFFPDSLFRTVLDFAW
jgi:hypothetical protein